MQSGRYQGKEFAPGVMLLTGYDLEPFQTRFCTPELADPYVTRMVDSIIVSGTGQHFLRFKSMDDLQSGGPYQVVWNDFYYADGTPMEGERYYAHSWDMKPALWSASSLSGSAPKLWDPEKDEGAPITVWYGGHMRPAPGQKVSRWPEDNYSRDVFAFVEKEPGKWFSQEDSIFSARRTWPRTQGSFLGHRYGHQIVMVPTSKDGRETAVPAVFYEEVTEARSDGSPLVTRIFMDEMETPFRARGNPVELVSPVNPATGQPFPSTLREDGSVLAEGPLYFRFVFEGEEWEAIGFSAGSFYGRYPSVFASRKLADGLQGKPFLPDLTDDGSDFNDAGAELGRALNLAGGPGRPSVIVASDGKAILGPEGDLRILVHGYRKDILPDNDYTRFPTKYRLDEMFRVAIQTSLKISRGVNGVLRFRIAAP